MPEKNKSKVVLRSVATRALIDAVGECLTACDWESWMPRGASVIIKPNLCTAVPEKVQACNTDVALVEALCELLRTRTNRIVIGEAGHLRQTPWQAFAASGYVEMARRLGIELVNFSESPTVRVNLEPAGAVPMPRHLLDADAYINMPVLKTHALTYFTGALKNQWGCVPDCHDRLKHHRMINPLLSSIQRLLKPKLVLMDAIVGMEGRGPVAGEERRLNLILASQDAVAIDAAAMRLVGLEPQKSRHVVLAAKQRLGRFEAADMELDGNWQGLAAKFSPPPRDVANRAMFFATQYSWFVKYVLANDRLYYPVRDTVKFLRRLGMVTR